MAVYGCTCPTQHVCEDVRPRWVYAYYDHSGAVLYVGCTLDRAARMQEHEARSPWWPKVATVDYWGPHPKTEALSIEAAMIAELEPPNNVFGTSRDPRISANLPARRRGRAA